MDIRILNKTFSVVRILDTIESFIWHECFDKTGDFEIYTRYTDDLYNTLLEDYYVSIPEMSDRTMIIEDREIRTDPENGDKLVITGRSIESILDRRIVLQQTQIDSSFQAGIQTLLNDAVINGVYPERNIPNFIMNLSSDANITSLNLAAQFYSEILLDVIESLCQQAGVGYRVLLNSSNQFVFSLYYGTDRSFSQSTNPYIVFSPENDNLVDSKYLETKRFYKNYVLVSGNTPSAWPGYPLRKQAWTPEIGTGLDRREMFHDATDLPLFVLDSGTEIPDSVYLDQLYQRGLEVLSANSKLISFDGEVRVGLPGYIYNKDYYLGDFVQLKDAYGHQVRTRVVEMTISENVSGKSQYPTLKSA